MIELAGAEGRANLQEKLHRITAATTGREELAGSFPTTAKNEPSSSKTPPGSSRNAVTEKDWR